MKVSVIIPVYNVEAYLPRCIDSVLAQTYEDLQILLVDDGSPDNSGRICDEYARRDPRIQVIHKPNGGVSNARNVALEQVSGEYVTFCDSDDFYEPGWIQAFVEAMEREEADMVSGNYQFYHEDPALNSVSDFETGVYELPDSRDRIAYCFRKLFRTRHSWTIWSRLFRTEIIRNHQLSFCETCGNFAEDIGFVLVYCLYCRRVVSIPEAGYLYFQRSGSMIALSRGNAKLDSVNEVSRYVEGHCRKALAQELAEEVLPVFHFFLMFNQYQVMMWANSPREAAEKIRNIARFQEWEEATKGIFTCREILKRHFGAARTRDVLRISESCLTGQWDSVIRDYRIHSKVHEKSIWMKEALQRVRGGKLCRK